MVAVGLRRRHALAGVETDDPESDPGRARNLAGDLAHIEESRAGRDAELDERDLAQAELLCLVGAAQDGIGVVVPQHQVEIDS
ncbi:hypothetical protein D3C83_53230 [compost metagenome]